MGLIRRIVVFTLVLVQRPRAGGLVIGVPIPALAATGEKSPPLTFNGRPLSELLHGRATGAPFPLPAPLQQADGQISGVVVDEDGRPQVEHAVQLTRVFSMGRNRAEQISGTSMTNVEGGFSFSGLRPSDYEIRVLVADAVIASATVTLVPAAMQVRGVTITRPPTPAVWDGTVLSSFEALQSALSVGQQIRVTDDAGRTTGKVVSISANQLVIERPRFFRRAEERAFPADVVQRIEIIDSGFEGVLLGMAPFLVWGVVACSRDDAENLCGMAPMLGMVIGGFVGGGVRRVTKPAHL